MVRRGSREAGTQPPPSCGAAIQPCPAREMQLSNIPSSMSEWMTQNQELPMYHTICYYDQINLSSDRTLITEKIHFRAATSELGRLYQGLKHWHLRTMGLVPNCARSSPRAQPGITRPPPKKEKKKSIYWHCQEFLAWQQEIKVLYFQPWSTCYFEQVPST